MRQGSTLLDMIENTPLVPMGKRSFASAARMFAKLEYFNPGGSIKDRTAKSLIEDGEKRGCITAGTIIVEPTSGNTGIGLAMICAVKGYRLLLTMPNTVSRERRMILQGLGAEIILTAGEHGMKGSIEAALRICEERKPSYMPMQFTNPANPRIHETTTGVEIWYDTGGSVDVFVAGVGTGGTITGVGRYLKGKKRDIRVIAVEPAGSPVLSGGKPGSHGIQGIGAGFIPDILDTGLIDEVIPVPDDEALGAAKALMREEGIMAGISSGAAVSAAMRVAERPENRGKNIVVIIPDTCERYLSTGLFDF